MPYIWNYFETGNGKGEHDGAGACIKTALHRQEMKFTTISLIRDVKTIVAWCSSMMGRELEGKKTNHLKKHMYIDIFGRWSMNIDHTYISARPSKELVHSIQLGRLTML